MHSTTHDTDYDLRFGAIRRLYGDRAYALLPQLHLCVVGIGGVGSWAAEALARSGVGRITLIDFDVIALSNVNRQLPASTATVGDKKIAVMAERIEQSIKSLRTRPVVEAKSA